MYKFNAFWINVFQVEELTLMPSELEKTITDHKKKLEKLEGDKKIEEDKLAAVMESLKTETKVWTTLCVLDQGMDRSVIDSLCEH